MIWFTSDWHFGHDKEFLYNGPRQTGSMVNNSIKIISRHNEVVNDDDDVYVLGDLILGDTEYGLRMIKELKGRLHIILGNHDSNTRIKAYEELDNVVEICYATVIKVGKQHYYLSHYPTLTANYDDKPYHNHMINLYGHTHQGEKFFVNGDPLWEDPNPFMYHVGVDSHDCYPVSIEQVSEDIHNLVQELYKKKVQREKEMREYEKEYYENGLGYFERHPLGEEIL